MTQSELVHAAFAVITATDRSLWCLQEAAADNQMKCEAVCAVGGLVAFQSLAAGNWLAPQLVSHMVGHGKQV